MESMQKKQLFQDYFQKQNSVQKPEPVQHNQEPVETNIINKPQEQQIQNVLVKPPKQQALQYPEIFQDSFFCYLVGPPGSGKSTILKELLENPYFYGGYFDAILFVSPNKFTDLQKNQNWIKKLELQFIYQFIADNQNKKICIVFDDVIADIHSLQKDKLMSPLILNRRHLNDIENSISIFVTSQKYNLLPLKFRVQITCAMLFYVCQKEWVDIRQEIIKHNDLKQIQRIIEKECSDKYKFIFLHNTNPFKLYNSQFQKIHLF